MGASDTLEATIRLQPDPRRQVYIELCTLSPDEREAHRSVQEKLVPAEVQPQEIIGEHHDGSQLLYFSWDWEGIAHKHNADDLSRLYPELVETYKRKKADGKLDEFDPSASYIHPDSRVKVLDNRSYLTRKTRKDPPVKAEAMVDSSDEGEEWDKDLPEDRSIASEEDSVVDYPRRRTTRSSAKRPAQRAKLPFSPKTTRLRRRMDSEGVESPAELEVVHRRSTRFRRVARQTIEDDAYNETTDEDEDDEDDEDEDYEYQALRRTKQPARKEIARGKASRPAYGHFRAIAELDWDPYDDDRTAALRAHRDTCEKCGRPPTHILLAKERKRPGKKRKRQEDEDDEIEGPEKIEKLGGWVRCLKCPLSAHWGCLASNQREEILKAARARDRQSWEAEQAERLEDGAGFPLANNGPSRRVGLDTDSITEFLCSMCMKGGICMGCLEVALEPDSHHSQSLRQGSESTSGDPVANEHADASSRLRETQLEDPSRELLFRCQTCRRLAHYSHLVPPDNEFDTDTPEGRAELARYYQETNRWSCNDCSSYVFKPEKILAWRPYPPDAVQPSLPAGEAPPVKTLLPREYLVKFQDRSYRRTQWVFHGWLAATHSGLLRSFLVSGPKVELLKQAVAEDQVANDVAEGGVGEDAEEMDPEASLHDYLLLNPTPDAERRIPPAWKTVDRVLDVLLWLPRKTVKAARLKDRKSRQIPESDIDSDDLEDELKATFEQGQQPAATVTETLDEYIERTGDDLTEADIDKVVWAFFKWDDLGYDQSSWDSPPRRGEPGYAAFQSAFKRFIVSQSVTVRDLSPAEARAFDTRSPGEYRKKYSLQSQNNAQPQLGQDESLKLMPFQIEGFDWLCDNWWNHQSCILADEMGLGKTVQVCTFVGNIIKLRQASPVLIIVPNSTITNWVREFARWAPNLRVVPFYGEAKAREVIKRYELTHTSPGKGITSAKYNVLVTTYNTITNTKEFTPVFKAQPRWESVIIDEGQRLNNDNSLLFRKLNELNSCHRIIMTGTPLNNKIRELFNLMNFLDPDNWTDLQNLEKEYEELTEDLVKQLHGRLRPYFLRRLKSDVLQLPPKNEVILPVSLTPLQKEMYKSILSKNIQVLMTLTSAEGPSKTRNNTALSKANMNNMLMQLRKCVQHPYLLSQDIKPKGLAPRDAHDRLVGASSKLRLLQNLLPKLKARGHRVLIFSQFVIVLNIIEDFLNGEGINLLRLDGNTPQAQRQKDMDEFNRPGSDVFVYILTTRAGGVGINLWSADTVIIFDPDFNPHQDLQAIARAHRYGQTKPCLVFKLMAKDTAEERIIQTGKKKLVLDHVIVQKINDDEGGADVQSILTYGAKLLFDEEGQESREINYSDHDLDSLIERTETEVPVEQSGNATSQTFSFAKIWTTDKDEFEELPDDAPDEVERDSWATTLSRIAKEREKVQAEELTGRGTRRKATEKPLKPKQSFNLGDSPKKRSSKKDRKRNGSDASRESEGWIESAATESEEDVSDMSVDAPDEFVLQPGKQKQRPPKTTRPSAQEDELCGLCGMIHPGPCSMADISSNLVEYRRLLFEASDEPFEIRREAVQVIDQVLRERGHLHLIQSQPIRLVEPHALYRPHAVPLVVPGPTATDRPTMQAQLAAFSGQVNPSTIKPYGGFSARPAEPSGSRLHTNGAVHAVPELGSPETSFLPSKRVAPGLFEDEVRKRAKYNSGLQCPVCGQAPLHLVKNCSVVAEGPDSISNAIARLEADPVDHSDTVVVLKSMWRKQAKGKSVESNGHI